MTNILICTLGASWAVIPEAYGFIAPEQFPLYQNHPQHHKLLGLKTDYNLQATDEIWVCTTYGEQTRKSLVHLQHWHYLCPYPPVLRIWQAEQTDQLASEDECSKIRELIVRSCLKAHHYADGGQVVLSLAGGRKTMSADMQWAGNLFGCQALLHIITADPIPATLREAQALTLTQALPEELAGLIIPLVAGTSTRSDLLDITVDNMGPIHSDAFPLTLPETGGIAVFQDIENTLTIELSKREKASSRLFGNFLRDIALSERHENWRSLYRLAPRRIEQLRSTMLIDQHKDWLISLPKADLHRHLGGCLNLADQRRVARTIWQNMTETERNQSLRCCKTLLEQLDWPWSWPEQLKYQGHRSHNSAALLHHASDEVLHYNLWQKTEPRFALKKNHIAGFAAYERPGELTGSALLSHPAAIKPYAEAIVHQSLAEGLIYTELRGSPQKYGDGLSFLKQFEQALKDVVASLSGDDKPLFRFIIIVDRRAQEKDLRATIELAIKAKQQLPDFIVGLDLAGDEQKTSPKEIAHLFTSAFEHCLPITIHAGEGEPAESIWQAAYHLHADRIGHGLTINDNDDLAQRFRDRNICLELCPSSNREVVGFKDPNYPQLQFYPSYPLLALWQKGLPLTICSDNPGISRTSLADEYLAAARMTENRISQWDVLAMIKQGFDHGFINCADKEVLLKRVDSQFYDLHVEKS